MVFLAAIGAHFSAIALPAEKKAIFTFKKSKSLAFQALLADPVVDNYQSAEKLLDTMMTFQNEHLGYLK